MTRKGRTMIDWGRHEQEIADARRGDRIADRVVSEVHRRGTRRCVLFAACAVVVATAIAVPNRPHRRVATGPAWNN